ncbi:RNA polymerase I-specific transcription initiation factor RRN3 [Toxorhynchites rutilus septentrionalis]|uniref:RNA polymerase I-specific transcription initiation factor RRN3 n=1 Tax=Toxorhynchites rutilus septentrionalis TaxID=329112 RepID=UPI002478F01A|nr:RNA polymerase I-specific transcription initiation factor RRN3 [Toxorhynchites rutilus septentrionalis]
MSIDTEKRRIPSILKPYSSFDGSKLNTSLSQNKVRFEDSSVELVLHEVLESNRFQRYELLVSEVKEQQFGDEKFQQIFVESKKCASLLDANFGMLVESLLSANWLHRNETSREVYKDFVIELLVAHNNYTSLAVSKLVQQFVPKDDERAGWSYGKPGEEKVQMFEPIHDLIVRLKNVIPMIFDIILVQMRKSFPYFKKPTHVVCGYLHNTLWMTEYSPMFTEELLEIIFSRMVVVDVNAPRNEIEDAEYPEDDAQMFSMEVKTVDGAEDEENTVMKLPLAETLDCCMEMMFEYISKHLSTDSSNAADRMFRLLLNLFDKQILPTHNTHHVQFLLFYLCSFKPSYVEYFVMYLWKQVGNPNVSTPMRQAAVGYIASILARGKFVQLSLLKTMLQELANWAYKYIQRADSMQHNQSLKAHMVFYSVCQTIFYVVAFRSRQLTANAKNLTFLQTLQLSSIVTCHLNPLRVCLPAVATAFAGVTRAHQLAYCHTILERNARRKLATVYKNDAQTPEECLDTFFPFDPYMLKKSGKRIDSIFLKYEASEAEEDNGISSPEMRGRKRCESMSEDVDDFIHEIKRLKNGASSENGETHFSYSYGVSPGFHS